MDRRRWAYRRAILRKGPEEALYAFLRARRRRHNVADDELELPPGERAAMDPLLDATPEALAANADVLAAHRAAGPIDIGSVEWIVPHMPHAYGGGFRTVLRFADHVARRHGVRQRFRVYDRPAAGIGAMRSTVRGAFPGLADAEVVGADEPFSPADAVVATAWPSAFVLVRHDRTRAKFFLVQDDEPRFFAAGSMSGMLEAAARIGFPGIVNTSGLADVYRSYGGPAVAFVPGVDADVFRPPASPRESAPVRVVFYGRPATERNAFALGLRALTLVKERFGERVDIVSAGEDWSPGQYGAAHVLRNAGALDGLEAVADLYRSSHVGLVLMLTAHPSYQPLEYMACGVATVSNANPRNAWLLRHEDNALLAPALPSLLAEQIGRLVDDEALRRRIADAGRRTVDGADWEGELERVWLAMTGHGPGFG